MTRESLKVMSLALLLARRGRGATSPNPMVGAVLVKGGKIIGRGWHRKAGGPHAEIEAIQDAGTHRHSSRGASLYVTLEPCCTHGRTPPCTDAIIAAGIRRVVVGTIDPNPGHSGRGIRILRRAGIHVVTLKIPGIRRARAVSKAGSIAMRLDNLARECRRLNEAFNHWITHRTPFVTVKAAMTLDGNIATAAGESKWITARQARAWGMKLRAGSDAILIGVNTVLADDPSLTVRGKWTRGSKKGGLRRIVLDSMARTPLSAKVVSDEQAALTTIVVGRHAPKSRVAALSARVNVLVAPAIRKQNTGPGNPGLDLRWLLKKLGSENVTSLLVEGGGEVNASFLLGGFAQRVVFFYAPMILGGRCSRRAVAGAGVSSLAGALRLSELEWRRLGPDLFLTARVVES